MRQVIDCIVHKIPDNVQNTKTIKVKISKRLYNSKYKRYYMQTYYRLVHYDINSVINKIKEGDKVKIHNTRRISARKSAVCYGA